MTRDIEHSQCRFCTLDTSIPELRLNGDHGCNYCSEFRRQLDQGQDRTDSLNRLVQAIQAAGKHKPYDCVVGISGGVDSTYLVYEAKRLGLRPLAVHLDNGWNSELAVSNIQRALKHLDIELYTHVIDWEEFSNLQRSFLLANVVDIEMLTDHAISAVLYSTAGKFGLRYILAGTNMATEGMRMPPGWNHHKLDLRNILDIHKRFGAGPGLGTFPQLSLYGFLFNRYVRKIRWVSLLDSLKYDKDAAIATLSRAFGYRPYEHKHYESIFTRFYQGYILPTKFDIDKRKIHYAALVCSGLLDRDQALLALQCPAYGDNEELLQDRVYVLQKLGLSEEAFENYMHSAPVPHAYYASDLDGFKCLVRLARALGLDKLASRKD